MPDMFEITAICRFYVDQYGMIFHNVYDPVSFVFKGHIVFRNTRKDYSIMCAGLSDKEIVMHFHALIYDVLAEESRKKKCLPEAFQLTLEGVNQNDE